MVFLAATTAGVASPWIMAGLIFGMAVAVVIAIAAIAARRRKNMASRPAVSAPAPFRSPPAQVLRKTQPIEPPSPAAISAETLQDLRNGMDIHQLKHNRLHEVLNQANSTSLDKINDDILREKIVRCVMGEGAAMLLPNQADALWGCVLSWDPGADEVEKQTTELLSWSCQDMGDYDMAKPIVEYSRHNIPLPDNIPMNTGASLVFDRSAATLIGEGASASVFRAHVGEYGDVAVKISRLTDYGILRNTLLEYMMLRRAQGIDAMIKLYGAGCYHVRSEVYFFIVEEIAQTNLADAYEHRRAAGQPFTEKEVRDRIVKPFLEALAKLHARGIIHRDLKPKNIYIVNGVCKIGDFEIAVYSRDESCAVDCSIFAGSPAYSTAGALVGRYGPETDINALACICYVMLRGDLPAIEDAPGTSTLVRGIQAGVALTQDDQLRQEKAKKAVQEWLTLKRGFVAELKRSVTSTPFERFFIAPIMSQGLYAETAPGAVTTATDALEILTMIELSEEAQDTKRKALELAGKKDFNAARKALTDFDALFHRKSHGDIEVSIHVMIWDALREIDELEKKIGTQS